YYTPAVLSAAVLLSTIPLIFFGISQCQTWLSRALVFLVVSCPCALVISVPLTYFAGIGGASHRGILVKGSNYLDALCDVKTVVFDKTGTLTKGVLKLDKIVSVGLSEQTILSLAAAAEANSNHPIAKAIISSYSGKILDAKNVKEFAGKGIRCIVNKKEILIGNTKLLADIPHEQTDQTAVYIAINQKFAGYIT
ncbi:HAD-IC family P-type ATPase, partial [Treponema sp. R6D11]